jgi:hypothetical protein
MYRSELVTLRTVGPHNRHLVVSVIKSQALFGDALNLRSTEICDECILTKGSYPHSLKSDEDMVPEILD